MPDHGRTTTALGTKGLQGAPKERGIVFEPNPEDSRKPTVGVLTMPNQKDRGGAWIANLSLRSESEGREIVRVLDPDKIHVDIEEILTDVAERGERRMR